MISIHETNNDDENNNNNKNNIKYKREHKRELPCKTWIITGNCPYNNKCIYLHSDSIKSNLPIKLHSKHKNRENNITDTLFWPKMNNISNSINTMYNVPYPENENMHDIALYSMWNHYVDFCKFTNMEQKMKDFSKKNKYSTFRPLLFSNPYDKKNKHTSRNRLNIFCELSESKKI
jgi:hypothetical protein